MNKKKVETKIRFDINLFSTFLKCQFWKNAENTHFLFPFHSLQEASCEETNTYIPQG